MKQLKNDAAVIGRGVVGRATADAGAGTAGSTAGDSCSVINPPMD